tara:strand:- start:64 stop:357 length:294 start_codon:yes stop_codon:yes gene_type:complete
MANEYKMVDDKLIELSDKEQVEWDSIKKESLDSQSNRYLEELRRARTLLLSETDYLALSDVTMTDAWKKYRQDLRDITKTFKSMSDKDFAFPTKPKG